MRRAAHITLTFFEYNALAALWVFRARGVQVAVLEVGLGGRLDAVNIVDAEAAVVCSIGLDHADWLGTDIEAIGREKAGVFRPGAIAVLADPAMTPSVEQEARRLQARTIVASRDYHWQHDRRKLAVQHGCDDAVGVAAAGLAGTHAIRQCRSGHGHPARNGTCWLPGRLLRSRAPCSAWRCLDDSRFVPGSVEWILDVAHNEPAARVLARNLIERPVAGRTLCVVAILGDKDIDAVARQLADAVDQWFLCGIDAPRGLPAAAAGGALTGIR